MKKSQKPVAAKRAKTRGRAKAPSPAPKGIHPNAHRRSSILTMSPAQAFKHGFVGSFKLVADTLKAVSSAGGRFIRDDGI